MSLTRQGSRPSSPGYLNQDLYARFESTIGNDKNPYNLYSYPGDQINIIKAGLKWEEGNWSSNDRMTLRQKLMYCYVRKQAHWDLAVNYNEYAKYLEIPKIILSSVLSTSLFVNATDNSGFSNTMQFINAGIGTSVAILVGIDSYAKFSELYNRHKNTSLEYSKLCAKIERLLQAKQEERQSFSVVLSKIDEKYQKIKEEAAFISQDKIDEFIELFDNENSCYEYVDSNLKTKIRNTTTENTTNQENTSKYDRELGIQSPGPFRDGGNIFSREQYNGELVNLSPGLLRNRKNINSTENKSVDEPVSPTTNSDIENQIP